MSDRLGWRMVGAICLLLATECSGMGSKFPDFSVERITCALFSLFWLWMCSRAWRRELREDKANG